MSIRGDRHRTLYLSPGEGGSVTIELRGFPPAAR
jgi:hypothetical protein